MKSKRISITQKIIDRSNPHDATNCYFYNAIKPLLKEETKLTVLASQYSINGRWYLLSNNAYKYISKGMRGIEKMEPKRFRIMLPEEYLK